LRAFGAIQGIFRKFHFLSLLLLDHGCGLRGVVLIIRRCVKMIFDINKMCSSRTMQSSKHRNLTFSLACCTWLHRNCKSRASQFLGTLKKSRTSHSGIPMERSSENQDAGTVR
jgi:hypothetical protein